MPALDSVFFKMNNRKPIVHQPPPTVVSQDVLERMRKNADPVAAKANQ